MSFDEKFDLPFAEPEAVGISSERLLRIAPVMRSYVDNGLIPGAVTMVARHGKVVHFDSLGYLDPDAKNPMEKDSLFRIASMTKPIVSLALMMLYEGGKFQLNDPLAKFLPDFSAMQVNVDDGQGGRKKVSAKRQINIRHVLTHTAGFPYELGDKECKEYIDIARPLDRSAVLGDFVARLAKVPLNNEPGKVWEYSRATCIVGHLIEVISGQNLKDFLQARIFDPLGMTDSHFFLPMEKQSRFAASYKPDENKKITVEDTNTEKSFFLNQSSEFYIGSGGLVSTAADYFKFAELLRQGGQLGSTRLISRTTLALMLQNHTGNKNITLMGPGYGFGLGFSVLVDPAAAHTIVGKGTYSWGGMYCTHWWNDPVEQLFGMVLTQVRPFDHISIRADMQVLAPQAIID